MVFFPPWPPWTTGTCSRPVRMWRRPRRSYRTPSSGFVGKHFLPDSGRLIPDAVRGSTWKTGFRYIFWGSCRPCRPSLVRARITLSPAEPTGGGPAMTLPRLDDLTLPGDGIHLHAVAAGEAT